MKKIIKAILIIICMISIFSFSEDTGVESTKKSDTVILGVSEIFGFDHLSKKEQQFIIDIFVVPVRKSAHFIIYFTLGLLLISFFKEFSYPIKKLVFLSIFLAFLYAISDEVHQLFVVGRSGRVVDVFIDTLGASTGVFIYTFIFRKRLKESYHE